jgi:hypothetical protein
MMPARQSTVAGATGGQMSELDVMIERMYTALAMAGLHYWWPVRVVLGEEPEPVWMEMRRIGAEQMSAAYGWLNEHLDTAYADLGLKRDPHITRGTE